uniref:Type I interferon h n=1 Tax=Takifugu obscurus TaxID=309541 RepID=A0A8F5V6D2_TAKOB|nr:type I interferon h [Takifugu obscurus]
MKTASRNKRLCCDWLAHFGHLSNQSLSLIRIMGGPLTNQQSPVSFPKELYRRAHNATVDFQLAFLRDSLKLLQRLWLKLFQHDELSSVTWGTTNTEHFLMTILRQHREVKRCVSKKRKADRKLVKYYLTLERHTLHQKANRTESWELIRKVTQHHLEQLHMLVASIIHAISR